MNIFIEKAYPLFQTGIHVSEGKFAKPTELQAHLKTLISQYRNELQSHSIAKTLIDHALFAILSYLDEKIIVESSFALEWFEYRIMITEFEEGSAGESFFSRLQSISQGDSSELLIATYLHCIHLGFKGKYQIEGPEALQLVVNALNQKLKKPAKETTWIAPHNKVEPGSFPKEKTGKGIYFTAVVFLSLALLVYGALVLYSQSK